MAAAAGAAPPVILCLQDSTGREVSLSVQPGDDFHTFLRKAKDRLGFEVDVSCITQNRVVALSDNVYNFLINVDESQFLNVVKEEVPAAAAQQLLAIRSKATETVYILDDGTQIKATQIQEDDCPTALDADMIPFVKYGKSRHHVRNCSDIIPRTPGLTKEICISKSPTSRANSAKTNQGFVNSLPFQPVVDDLHPELISLLNQTTDVFSTSKQTEMSKEIHPTPKLTNESSLIRKRILNMLRNSPIKQGRILEQKSDTHIRKTDPKPIPKNVLLPNGKSGDADSTDFRGRNRPPTECSICSTAVKDEIDEIYVFSSEDQKRYRSSPDRELSVKVICKMCLDVEFSLCRELANEKTLEHDEYLVIQHNQQYIYKKIAGADFKTNGRTVDNVKSKKLTTESSNTPIIKLKTIEKGKIKTQTIEEGQSSVDIKLENLKRKLMKSVFGKDSAGTDQTEKQLKEDLDDQVQKFLAKKPDNEMKCRFCEQIFEDLDTVVEHSAGHHLSDEDVYPCPLCEYGYQTFSWLRKHMRSKHMPQEGPLTFREEAKHGVATPSPSSDSEENECQTPVALRTRSAVTKKRSPLPSKKKDKTKPKKPKKIDAEKSLTATASTENLIRILEGDKNQSGSTDEEGIWIVESKQQVKQETDESESPETSKTHQCSFCSKRFVTKETMAAHEAGRCHARRGKAHAPGPVCIIDDVYMPSEADFLKRAKGRRIHEVQWLDEDDGTLRPKYRGRKGATEPTSDPSLLMCDDCGATFTSKVRLKFHIQFHSQCKLLTADGRYCCGRCNGDKSTFSTEAELFDHLHFQHGKRSRWLCPVSGCHKTFFLRAMLTKHSRAHTDTRRYICGVCDKRFLDKQTLDEHSVTHLKIKPFQCHLCLKQLTRRSRLRMHLRAHEEHLTPRLVRACLHCQRAFKNLADAEEHARTSECVSKKDPPQTGEEAIDLPQSGLVTMHIENLDPDEPDEESEVSYLLDPHNTTMNSLIEPGDEQELQSMVSEMNKETRRVIRIVKIEKAFRCEFCEDVFYVESSLNKHRAQHKGVKNPFTCHICKVSFPTYSRCTTHKTTHGFFKRSVAEVKRDVEENVGRLRREQTGPNADGIVGYGDFPVCKHFLCEDCGRSYLHWTYLQVHRRMKHPAGDCVYRCGACDITFPNSWGLAYHKRKLHGPNPRNEERKSKNGDLKLPCRDCDGHFPNKSALYTHRRKVHRSERKPYTPKGLGLFSCATCGKCYAGRPGLDAHLRSHGADAAGGAQYACARCGVAYQSSAQLTRHVVAMHAAEASQMCATCGATFVSPSLLSAHVRSHSPRRPHACAACGHAFRTASMLAEHARIHTGERPFPCDICGMSFRRSTARRNHRLIHTGERPFSCPQCPKRFRIRSDLRTHFRTKHPHQILVLEVRGLNPEPEAVIEKLHLNHIALDKVLEIAKISFPKGTPNLMLDPEVTLEKLQRSQDEGSALWSERIMTALESCRPKRLPQPQEPLECGRRRGRGIARRDRERAAVAGVGEAEAENAREAALQLQYGDQNTFHVEIRDVAVNELTELLGGVLTRDGCGVLLNTGQFVPFDSVRKAQEQPPQQALYPGVNYPAETFQVTGFAQESGFGQEPGTEAQNYQTTIAYDTGPLQGVYSQNNMDYQYSAGHQEYSRYGGNFAYDNGQTHPNNTAQGLGNNMYEGERIQDEINEFVAFEGKRLPEESNELVADITRVIEGERDAALFEQNPNEEFMNVESLDPQIFDDSPETLQADMENIQNDEATIIMCDTNGKEFKFKIEQESNLANASETRIGGEREVLNVFHGGTEATALENNLGPPL